jgi:hypothetical protein
MYLIESDFGPYLPTFYCAERKSGIVWKFGIHLFEMRILQFCFSFWP